MEQKENRSRAPKTPERFSRLYLKQQIDLRIRALRCILAAKCEKPLKLALHTAW